MKTKTIFRFLIGMVIVLVAAIAIEPSLQPSVAHGFFDFLNGAKHLNLSDIVAPVAAAQAVTETVTTGKVKVAAPNLLRPEISNTITKVRPDIFPMDTILRQVGHIGKCDSREYKFYSSAVRGVADTLTAAHIFAEVDSCELSVTNVHIWLKDDIAFFPEKTDNNLKEIRAKITKVDNAGKKSQ